MVAVWWEAGFTLQKPGPYLSPWNHRLFGPNSSCIATLFRFKNLENFETKLSCGLSSRGWGIADRALGILCV
jgi:hypothetical protein